MEKDQALADLNSVEKSLADLFRRYEKMKDVLEGFRKVTQFIPRFLSIWTSRLVISDFFYLPPCVTHIQNEEVLKKCAQEYLSRVRKEEQRYQALKIHAEEKLDRWVCAYSYYVTFSAITVLFTPPHYLHCKCSKCSTVMQCLMWMQVNANSKLLIFSLCTFQFFLLPEHKSSWTIYIFDFKYFGFNAYFSSL